MLDKKFYMSKGKFIGLKEILNIREVPTTYRSLDP